jgi:hypothetical protein
VLNFFLKRINIMGGWWMNTKNKETEIDNINKTVLQERERERETETER